MLKSLRSDFVLVLILLSAALFGLTHLFREVSSGQPFPPGRDKPADPTHTPVPLTEAAVLFDTNAVPSQTLPAGVSDGFYTTHFEPPPQPPPQKPTTRKVELTYLGFLQADDGPRTAVVQSGAEQWTGRVGSNLVANVFVTAIDQHTLVVTNTEGQTNRLEFRNKTSLDVPVK